MATDPTRPPADDDLARKRWQFIQLSRAIGFGLAILGIMMSQGAVELAGEYNAPLGMVFVVLGLVGGFVVPIRLARKWRSGGGR